MIGQIGSTPLIRLRNIPPSFDIKCQVYAKCEFLNPTGSTSDRLVLQQFRGASKDVLLSTGHAVTEGDLDTCLSSSWLSSVGKLVPVSLPKASGDDQSIGPEYLNILKASGARVIPTSANENETHPNKTRNKVDAALSNKFFVTSELTPLNVATAYSTVGQEILTQLGTMRPRMIVCGGEYNGATLYGVTMCLREGTADGGGTNDSFLSVGVDFSGNTFNKEIQSGGQSKQVPFEWKWKSEEKETISLVERSLEKFSGDSELWRSRSEVTKWVKSSDAASYFTARRLVREEGLLVGPTAGAVLNAAVQEINANPGLYCASELRADEGAVVVVVLNDSLWKDSRDFLSDKWMLEKKYFKTDNMEALYWWYDMPLMTIKTDPLVQLPPEIKKTEALQALRKVKARKGIVCSGDDSKPLGVISLEMLEVFDEDDDDETSVGDLCSSSMAAIDSRGSISAVVPLLDNHSFVLIVQKSPTLKKGHERSPLSESSTAGSIGIDTDNNVSPGDNEDEGNNNNNSVEIVENQNPIILASASLLDMSSIPKPANVGEVEAEVEVKEVILGIFETRDLVAFQRELEIHHEVSYGIRLSDGIPSCDWYKDFK